MRREVLALVLVGGLAFGAGGCAKHEMVKAEEPLVPSATAAKPPVKVSPPVQSALPAPTNVESAPVKVAPLPAPPSSREPTSQANELRSSLEKIFFNFDSVSLSQEARDRLVKNADLMKKDPDVKVQIEGHCDERGSDEYNLALGEKRARAAMKYLTELGIPADHLSVISYGKEKPADRGHDEAAWAKNRRDEFVVPQR
jgi:peptidoglycan-associated lipoprotein